jgi:hypothetical protein
MALLLREFDFATMGVGKSFIVYSCRFYLAWTELSLLSLSLAVYRSTQAKDRLPRLFTCSGSIIECAANYDSEITCGSTREKKKKKNTTSLVRQHVA